MMCLGMVKDSIFFFDLLGKYSLDLEIRRKSKNEKKTGSIQLVQFLSILLFSLIFFSSQNLTKFTSGWMSL